MNTQLTLNRIKQIIVNILCVTCLTSMLLYLHAMGNEMYDTLKNINAAKAILMLTLFMFIIQKVRLLNWQSAVATILYLPLASAYRERNSLMPDLQTRDIIVTWIVWILILIAVDMFVYKKANSLHKMNQTAFLFFALMAVTMMFYRNGRTHPAIFIPAFIFYLIPLSKVDWKRIINQICSAWIITFFIILYRSVKNNPGIDEIIGRWFGDFLNIGDFGLFVACTATIILYKIYESKTEYGRKSISYVLYLLCLFPLIWTIFRVSTITMFIGILGVFLAGFIFVRKNTSVKNIAFRSLSVVFCLTILILGTLVALKVLANTDKDYWEIVLFEGDTFLKPIANLIQRAHYMFDEVKTFADCEVFEPGTMVNYLDLFTSGRLSIIVCFSELINFTGNTSAGIQVGNYYAYNAHNTYIQMLYEYGYVGGGFFLAWLFYMAIAGIRRYLRKKRHSQVLLCIWMFMTFGVLLGERVYLYSPIVIMLLLFYYPLLNNTEDEASS